MAPAPTITSELQTLGWITLHPQRHTLTSSHWYRLLVQQRWDIYALTREMRCITHGWQLSNVWAHHNHCAFEITLSWICRVTFLTYFTQRSYSAWIQRQKVRLKEASHWKGITPSGLLSSLSYIQDVEQGSRETPSTSPYFFPVQREPGLSHDAPGCIQRQTFVKKTVWWCTCVQTALKKKKSLERFYFHVK